MTINLFLLILACILELLAAIGVPSARVNLVALGLFCYLLSLILQ